MASAHVQLKKETTSAKNSRADTEALHGVVGDLRDQIAALSERIRRLEKQLQAVVSREDDLKKIVQKTAAERDELYRRNEDLHVALYALQARVDAREQAGAGVNSYQQLVMRVRNAVRECLPRDATLLVASKGDDVLLQLYGRNAWHFPQAENGVYAGHHPASSIAAIAQMEFLRAKGANYLLIPSTMFWWMDHYVDFNRYLEAHYRTILRQEDTCLLFELRRPQDGMRSSWDATFNEAVLHWQSHSGEKPSILDWNTGFSLAARFSDLTVFSPSKEDPALPYIDASVDMVAISSSSRLTLMEAQRVAKGAVIRFSHPPASSSNQATIEIDWKLKVSSGPQALTSSIVISCTDDITQTERCLRSVNDSLPRNFDGEILIVQADHSDFSTVLDGLAKSDRRVRILRNRKSKGFVAACNFAARAARGDILVFVNSAALPLAGWLPPLLQIFRDYPKAGGTGGRHVDPGGRLLEAGGIVLSEGSLAGFGNSDLKADAPSFNYVRKVDYCSISFFATYRALFTDLNGFDDRPASLQAAAADYGRRARQKGFDIYYQPESAVVVSAH